MKFEDIKFENIKVGDTVMIEDSVTYGWYKSKRFWIPKKVIRVSKAQFVIEGGKRFKKNGKQVGVHSYGCIGLLSEIGGYRDEVIKDQTKERNAFVKKINLEDDINASIDVIKIQRNSPFTHVELKTIFDKLESIRLEIESKKVNS